MKILIVSLQLDQQQIIGNYYFFKCKKVVRIILLCSHRFYNNIKIVNDAIKIYYNLCILVLSYQKLFDAYNAVEIKNKNRYIKTLIS